MDNKNRTLDEQEAPEKNGDAAYVQVGADGKPVMPQVGEDDQPDDSKAPQEGTLADR